MMFYKETSFKGVAITGKIPMNWEGVRINEICGFKRGFSYRGDQITEDATNIRFITINDYEKEGGSKQDNERLYLKDGVEPDSDFVINQDDVLIANTDMSRGFIIGAPIHIESVEGKLVYSMDSTKLISDKNKMNGKFLFYLLKHKKVRRKVKTLAQGTNVLHLNHELFKNLRIPLPSLPEQMMIVEVLGVVDSAIELADKIVAKTERLKKGLMQKLLTRGIGHTEYKETSIGKTPKTWESKPLEDVCTAIVDCPHTTPKFTSKGFLIVRNFNIRDGELSFDPAYYTTEEEWQKRTQRCVPQNDDVLFSREAPIGEASLAPRNISFSLGQRTMLLRTDKKTLIPLFLVYAFYSPLVRRKLRNLEAGVTAHHVNVADVRRLIIPLPTLAEQEKIANIILTTSEKLGLEKKERAELELLKQGLMDLLLTGKVRIRVG